MHLYDKLLVGIGISLIGSLVATGFFGTVGILPLAIVGIPLVAIALFMSHPTDLHERQS